MTKRWRSAADERGQATFSLIIVLVVVAIAVVLLQRTASTAESINDKAGNISSSASGINESTKAVLKLGTTNDLAGSILATAQPLEGSLNEVIRLAQSIDGLATSINDSASTINGTANGHQRHRVDDPHHRPSASTTALPRSTRTSTRRWRLPAAIKADTGDIRGRADRTTQLAAAIDAALP